MVNLELYRVFYTVAKFGSSTRAAEELFISQPAVSQAIKQLENQLGTTLFNRTHMGMELSTQGGKLIFKQVEEALALLDDAESKLLELKTTATGTIRIGATDAIFSHILADKIVAYNQKYPAVKFELLTGTTPETLDQLKEGKCDVGFINLPVDDKDVNFTGTVAHLSDVFVAGREFEHLKGKKVNLADLQGYPLLMIESNTIARRALSAYTQTLGIQLHPDIEVENWDLMMKFASSGMGIGCVPREYAAPLLESGELFEVDVVPHLPVRGVGIALPKNTPVQYALKEFISMF
ncbi:MAG: LysR family transcriptional regulator [Clostridia bacterium]|nr:LysR family transcriptional regulator [Clostridia bacterium]